MKGKFDTEEILLSENYLKAIEKMIEAELEMMCEQHDAECWTWGECVISDLAYSRNLSFSFGGDEDRPAELPEGKSTLIRFQEENPNKL